MATKSKPDSEKSLDDLEVEDQISSVRKSSSSDVVGVLRPFEDAYITYMLELRQVWTDAERLSEDAYRTYLHELEEVSSDARRRYEDLYRNYLSSLHEASSSEETKSGAEDQAQDFQKNLQQVWGPDDTLKCFEAYSRYMKALEDAWNSDKARGRFEAAYRSYLNALKRAWGQADTGAINPYYLAVIGESIKTAASWANLTLT
jgi:type I site-specific restriction-modification system R (restriction) subunit